MSTFFATLMLVAAAMAAMAVGAIFAGRALRGSCGGQRKDCHCTLAERRICRAGREPGPA
ncbi:MAG: DUF539 domain-containing protein [Proteobacteria bacterium]|nr:DUF539 domain-containing protein [Pseudomonadota bacterium]